MAKSKSKRNSKPKPSSSVVKNQTRIIRSYTNQQLCKALNDVKNGVPIRMASQKHKVPYSTLQRYNSTGKHAMARMGPEPTLGGDHENILVRWIIAMQKRRFPITKNELLDAVEKFVIKNKVENSFTENRPGLKWMNLFLQRHPEISVRTAQNLVKSRLVKKSEIRRWFEEVELYLKEENLLDILQDTRRIFNADETAFFLCPKGEKVLAEKGSKIVHSVTGNNEKENVTTLVCGNAAGTMAPPMVVYKYDRIPAVVTKCVPDDWGIGRSETGWMTSGTFYEYIANVFLPWLNKQNIPKPIILFLDGHASHLTLQVSELCSKNGIELISLYPNATHILQPMDCSVFHPMKSKWKKAVRKFKKDTKTSRLLLPNFAPLLRLTLRRLKRSTIANGFKHCGLNPFKFENVKFFTNKKKVLDASTSSSSCEELLHAREIIEERIDPDVLELFKKLYRMQGEHEIEERHISLYHVWSSIVEEIAKDDEPSNAPVVVINSINELPSNIDESTSVIETSINDSNADAYFNDYGLELENIDVVICQCAQSSLLNSTFGSENAESNYCQCESTRGSEIELLLCNTTTSSNSILDSSSRSRSSDNVTDENIPLQQPESSTTDNSRPKTPETTIDDIHRQMEKNNKTPENSDSFASTSIPSPFKDVIRFPENLPQTKKRRKKDAIPFAVTSKAWKQYHYNKAEQKNAMEKAKQDRQLQREEKKKEAERLKIERKKQREEKKEQRLNTKRKKEEDNIMPKKKRKVGK